MTFDTLPSPAKRAMLRRACGLTQAQIAAEIDVTPAAVGYWENGTEPRGRNRREYARVLAELQAHLTKAAA